MMHNIMDANKCTIIWLIYDIKTSHEDSCIVTLVIELIDYIYGKISLLILTMGNVHSYLVIKVTFTIKER